MHHPVLDKGSGRQMGQGDNSCPSHWLFLEEKRWGWEAGKLQLPAGKRGEESAGGRACPA